MIKLIILLLNEIKKIIKTYFYIKKKENKNRQHQALISPGRRFAWRHFDWSVILKYDTRKRTKLVNQALIETRR